MEITVVSLERRINVDSMLIKLCVPAGMIPPASSYFGGSSEEAGRLRRRL